MKAKKTSNVQAAASPKQIATCGQFELGNFGLTIDQADKYGAAFLDNFLLDGTQEFSFAEVTIPYSAFNAFKHDPSAPANACKGMRIHYGLNGSGGPVFIFSPENMIPDTGADPLSVYFKLQFVPKYYVYNTLKVWDEISHNDADTAFKAYKTRVWKLVDGKPKQLTFTTGEDSDSTSTFFPFEEVQALIEHNGGIVIKKMAASPLIDLKKITNIQFRWSAVSGGSPASLKHDVMMIPVLNGVKYKQLNKALETKAANLNHRCPPFCDSKPVSYKK